MRRLTGAELDFGAFTADDYQDLIDHPVLMGELTRVRFEAAGVPHVLVIAGRHDADVTRLERDLARLCSWHIDFFGRPAPMDRYWFLLQARSGGTGGLEHRCSSALMCGPDHLPRPGVKPVSNGYRRFLGLVSHEYFHAWLAKRIRPLEFVETDLSSEAYTRQLWIFEGITSYYDDLALVRAGLISVEAYLEALGQNLTRLYRTPGRRQQTLEEASFDAWIKFYRPDENSANATVSYYLKGSLVALALDLDIRLRSAGRRSLDDVMRTLWLEYGLPPDAHGLPDGAFERLAAEASGLDLDDFFRQAIRSTVDPPLGILLAQFGIRLELRAAESADDRGGTAGKREPVERLWIGAAFRVADGRQCVTFVQDGGPARAAGLLPGDELVAIDGRRVTAENLDQLVNQMRPDETVEVHLLRGDELSVLSLRPEAAPKDTCYLVLDKEAPIDAVARRNAWLGK
jgi:predicted metalloprotease with PDZ domain